MINPIISAIAATCYLLASWSLVQEARSIATKKSNYCSVLALLAMVFHASSLALIWIPLGGITLGFFEALSVESLFMAVIYFTSMRKGATRQLGVLILPVAAALTILGSLFHASHPASAYLSWQLQAHAIFALLAYGLLSMATAQALLLAIQEYILRHPRYLSLLRLMPSLTQMEDALFQLVRSGFYLLTITLITGAMFVENLFAQHLAHKTILSILSWLVFGYLLSARKRFGWRGRIAIRWTLTGMTFLLLSYFGSKMVLELIIPS